MNERLLSLDDSQLKRLAELVAETLVAATPQTERLVDVAGVAKYLSVEPAWVYAHADELGARRLGSGARPRLRFSLHEVDDRLMSRAADGKQQASQPASEARSLRRRRRMENGADLLPIRGSRAAA